MNVPAADGQPSYDGGFPATRWSLVLSAQVSDSDVARRAMSQLCAAYWYPLYAYARRRGMKPEDAEDITQDFFRTIIARDSLRAVDPRNGRLRAFLLAAMKRHLASDYRRATAEKRGGSAAVLPIDRQWAEDRLSMEPAHERPADELFDQSWAYAVLDSAMRQLEGWYAGARRRDLWESIRGFLTGNADGTPYPEVAAKLRVTEQAVRSAVHKMRQRFRLVIERDIQETVSGPAEAAEEVRYLCRVLGGFS